MVVEVEVVGMMVVAAVVTGEAVARRGLLLVGEMGGVAPC